MFLIIPSHLVLCSPITQVNVFSNSLQCTGESSDTDREGKIDRGEKGQNLPKADLRDRAFAEKRSPLDVKNSSSVDEDNILAENERGLIGDKGRFSENEKLFSDNEGRRLADSSSVISDRINSDDLDLVDNRSFAASGILTEILVLR